jgi:hypothetical protein
MLGEATGAISTTKVADKAQRSEEPRSLVAAVGVRCVSALVMPRLVFAAASPMDRCAAVVAAGARSLRRSYFRCDPRPNHIFTRPGLAVTDRRRVYLWVLGLSSNLRQYCIRQRIAFLIARYLARDRVRRLLARRQKYRAFDRAITEEGWQIVLLLRLSPIVPFNLQNYALGVTAIPFIEYLGATLVGITPGIAIYVYFGIFGKGLESSPSLLDWVLFGLGAVATAALALLVTWKAKAKFAHPASSRP